MSVANVVCRQVEVYATDLPLVQIRPTEFGVSACNLENSSLRRSWPHWTAAPRGKQLFFLHNLILCIRHFSLYMALQHVKVL